MTDDLEKRMREKAEALLAARASAPAVARDLTAKERAKRKRMAAKMKRTRAKNRKAKRATFKPKGPNWRALREGTSLAHRLLARTEPDVWYSFRELEALLPEVGRNSTHAVVYQKLPARGWIERKAIVPNVQASWLNHDGPPGEKAPNGRYKAMLASTAPKYVYRIGAKQAVERAQARVRLAEKDLYHPGEKRAPAGEFDGFEDL